MGNYDRRREREETGLGVTTFVKRRSRGEKHIMKSPRGLASPPLPPHLSQLCGLVIASVSSAKFFHQASLSTQIFRRASVALSLEGLFFFFPLFSCSILCVEKSALPVSLEPQNKRDEKWFIYMFAFN